MVSPPGHRIAGGLGLSLGWGECIGKTHSGYKLKDLVGEGGGRLGKGWANLSYLTRGELVWG